MRNRKTRSGVDNSNNNSRSHASMMGKVVASFIGARIAAHAGKSGAIGALGGMVVNRVVRRSPMGALLIGGIWISNKLYKRHLERKFDAAARAAKRVPPAKVPPADTDTPAPGR